MTSLIYNVILLAVQVSSNKQGPPPPNQNRAPGVPIDDNIWLLIVIGIIFGIYIIYRRKSATNKAS